MNTMLSVWSQFFYEMSPEDAVLEFKRNGIYASELSDEHGAQLFSRSEDRIETGRKFREFLREQDFCMTQGHLWLNAKICGELSSLDTLFKWIDMYEAIGIKNMVLHCDSIAFSGLSKAERVGKNIERLKIIADHVKDKDIYICLENLRAYDGVCEEFVVTRTAEDILRIIEKVGSDRFGICLDTGHLNLTDKDQRKFILTAGSKLRALHIADNEGKGSDQHMMPFAKGKIDFGVVVAALREIDYNGLFNLEIPGETKIPLELRREKIKYIKACYDYLMTR